MQQQLLQRNKYLETTVQTATPGQLLVMLYDGAIRFCRQAIEAINGDRYAEANEYLIKAQNIISEFIITLDRKSPFADNLLALYDYYNYLLVQANVNKSAEPAEEVLGYLIEMKETWVQAAKMANHAAAGAGANGYGIAAGAAQSPVV